MIPHGAAPSRSPAPSVARPGGQPIILTWGLLGEGKGIEWAIERDGAARRSRPAPHYRVVGQTHPKVKAHQGEAYRDRLIQRAEQAARPAWSTSTTAI